MLFSFNFLTNQSLTKHWKSSHFHQFDTITPLCNPPGYKASRLEHVSQIILTPGHDPIRAQDDRLHLNRRAQKQKGRQLPYRTSQSPQQRQTFLKRSQKVPAQRSCKNLVPPSREQKKAFKPLFAQEKMTPAAISSFNDKWMNKKRSGIQNAGA